MMSMFFNEDLEELFTKHLLLRTVKPTRSKRPRPVWLNNKSDNELILRWRFVNKPVWKEWQTDSQAVGMERGTRLDVKDRQFNGRTLHHYNIRHTCTTTVVTAGRHMVNGKRYCQPSKQNYSWVNNTLYTVRRQWREDYTSIVWLIHRC